MRFKNWNIAKSGCGFYYQFLSQSVIRSSVSPPAAYTLLWCVSAGTRTRSQSQVLLSLSAFLVDPSRLHSQYHEREPYWTDHS